MTTTTLPAVRSRLERVRARTGPPPLLLTDYGTPAVAECLTDHDTAFVDGAGNVHLDGTAAYVVILGRPRRQKSRTSGFIPIELELICALLAEPRLLGAPVREVSERTGISTCKVSGLLAALAARAPDPRAHRAAGGRVGTTACARWPIGCSAPSRTASPPMQPDPPDRALAALQLMAT
mgnify:CR=1 FL=1